MSDVTNHVEMIIQESAHGDIVYPVTVGIEVKQLYTTTIIVLGKEGIVDVMNLNFSELGFV